MSDLGYKISNVIYLRIVFMVFKSKLNFVFGREELFNWFEIYFFFVIRVILGMNGKWLGFSLL